MTKFAQILDRYGKLGLTKSVTWMQRQVSEEESNQFSGEPEITFESQGAITIILMPLGLTPGFPEIHQEVETRRIWTASAITYLDRIVMDGKTYSVGPVERHEKAGYYRADIKWLVETV